MINTTIKHILAASVVACACGQAVAADEHVPAVTEYVNENVMPWLTDPIVVNAVKAQNDKNAGISQADIDALDQKWRAGVDGGDTTLIEDVLANELSDFLRSRQAESGGTITEVFVMDNKGLNVGQSDVTSDYWQGDEGKWQKTYGMGPSAVFVDEVEKDESTQTLQSQASVTIADEAGNPIGAITIGIDLSSI
ncbi:hypothetical protein [Oricola sp.]|uniref:hypothetical protein n=1 Tax=Oricola sp. TaxID=1979950 RepID=UPI003BAD9791